MVDATPRPLYPGKGLQYLLYMWLAEILANPGG
jgi:hypothetical protein